MSSYFPMLTPSRKSSSNKTSFFHCCAEQLSLLGIPIGPRRPLAIAITICHPERRRRTFSFLTAAQNAYPYEAFRQAQCDSLLVLLNPLEGSFVSPLLCRTIILRGISIGTRLPLAIVITICHPERRRRTFSFLTAAQNDYPYEAFRQCSMWQLACIQKSSWRIICIFTAPQNDYLLNKNADWAISPVSVDYAKRSAQR